ICPGTPYATINPTSSVPGTTYSWVATSDTVLSGYPAFGTDSIPSQVIANPSLSPDTVVFTVTPSASGCAGSPKDHLVIVHPSPDLHFSQPSPQTICSGQPITPVVLTSSS